MSTIKSDSEDLTLNAHGSGNDIKFQSNSVEVGSLTAEGVMTSTTFAGSGASLTALPAAQLTGALPAISGASLTNLPTTDISGKLNLSGGTMTGNILCNDNVHLRCGTGSDLRLHHDGTDSYIDNVTGQLVVRTASSETAIVVKPNAAVELFFNDVKKFETNASGFNMPDNSKAMFGNNDDLQIYHDGTHSYFKNSHTSGSTRFNQKYFEVNNTAGTESMLSAYEDGAVTLRHNGVEKFKTTADGIEIQGEIEMGGNLAITGESGSDRLTIHENTGAVWIDGSCSAASFIDRTPYPETLQLAYDVINSHKKLPDGQYKADDQSKQLDHSNLHEYVSLTTPATLWTENHNLPEGVSVGDIKKEEEKSRNMSGVISCLVEVIKDLSAKNEALTTRIETLEA